ncbi:MAG TPA: hypothetical protein VGC78_06785 [Gaiellaceae bacterium]|jgi:hypothetical protein
MSTKGIAAAAAAVAGGLLAASATAGTMHPELGARLAGMGEHGVVNITVKAAHHDLCWTFDIPTKGATRATVRDAHGMIVVKLGTAYARKGCAMVGTKALALLDAKPSRYSVWVDTKGHPGDLRGKLFAGMAHM